MGLLASIPINNLQGTRQIPSTAVPGAVTQITIALDGAQMTDTALNVVLNIDYSPDGGTTWATTSRGPEMDPFPVVVEFQGGNIDKHGQPLDFYAATVTFPAGANRRVRGSLVVTGARLTTTATITSA